MVLAFESARPQVATFSLTSSGALGGSIEVGVTGSAFTVALPLSSSGVSISAGLRRVLWAAFNESNPGLCQSELNGSWIRGHATVESSATSETWVWTEHGPHADDCDFGLTWPRAAIQITSLSALTGTGASASVAVEAGVSIVPGEVTLSLATNGNASALAAAGAHQVGAAGAPQLAKAGKAF